MVQSLEPSQSKDGKTPGAFDAHGAFNGPGGLEPLDISGAENHLPSAAPVWSPILAFRAFVEPLTARASAAAEHGASFLRQLTILAQDQGTREVENGRVVAAENTLGAAERGMSGVDCPNEAASAGGRLPLGCSLSGIIIEESFARRRSDPGPDIERAEEKAAEIIMEANAFVGRSV